jgi:hypothetical protein
MSLSFLIDPLIDPLLDCRMLGGGESYWLLLFGGVIRSAIRHHFLAPNTSQAPLRRVRDNRCSTSTQISFYGRSALSARLVRHSFGGPRG